MEGIRTFDMRAPTCLLTDWSKLGMGYMLMQKRCSCAEVTPYCCKGGWALVLAGSRFNTGAESRYAPVEGEAATVAWALENTRYYTLGNAGLIVATDHKPLLKVLGDRKLEEVQNPRLLRIKEATLRWRFKLVHVPGKIHFGPDVLSRQESVDEEPVASVGCLLEEYRDHPDEAEELRSMEIELVAGQVAAAAVPEPLSWDMVRNEGRRDKTTMSLIQQIRDGFPPSRKIVPEHLRPYWRHRDELYVMDDVVMYKERVVIPTALRKVALEVLHAAHQGVRGMQLRAESSVWWPGITPEIQQTRDQCRVCDTVAPSQPRCLPEARPEPDYPFQLLCADHFDLRGQSYLCVVDRFSGWPVVEHCGVSAGSSGKFIASLRALFSVYGVPEELATDGSRIFTSFEVKTFLTRFGVRHRVSSAYYAHSNQRAELGVKAMKRLCRENLAAGGRTDCDAFLRAMMAYRNTPDRDTGRSPAQVLFGRKLRDFLPGPLTRYKPAEQWRLLREDRERALAKRAARNTEAVSQHARKYEQLSVGDVVRLQNQSGANPTRWDLTGEVVEVGDHQQY